MATITKIAAIKSAIPTRKRVAAYARVSSGKDAMLHSMSAQISYYSNLIQRNPEWVYMGVYADEALTGTTDSRAAFQRMLTDCRDGKIDRIITKSISRFARNTVTLLETVRELKDLGVDVYFEEQNIHSTSGDGELMLTILASFAQEESRSVSENCKWRIRSDFKEGKPSWFHIYGYTMVNGRLELVPDEAAVVKMIFLDYVDGMGCGLIQKKLIELNIPASQGGEWSRTAISYMLKNECYVGDLLLQKYFIKDHLSKQVVWNRGELPQYYVHDSHEPIIERNVFDKAQQIMAYHTARFHPDKKAKDRYPFSGIIFCGQCGKYYRRKLTAKGTKPVWICFTFNGLGKKYCQSKQIPEDILMQTTARVLGLPSFEPDELAKQIDHIDVSGDKQLQYHFRDGRIEVANWNYESRSTAWTAEKRAAAGEKTRRRYENERSKS